MDIYINANKLDVVAGQETEITWENMRFTEPVADQWTTDIELPQSGRNIAILGACGLLDGGSANFTQPVRCHLVIEGVGKDGYLHVTSMTKDTITVACFVNTIPYELYDRELKEFYPRDTPSSTFRWDRFTKINNSLVDKDIDMLWYDYNDDYYTNILAQIHPSVKCSSIVGQIEHISGCTLPVMDSDLYMLATKKVVAPDNNLQCLMGHFRGTSNDSGTKFKIIGGQHITNDMTNSWSYKDFKWNQYWSDWDAMETLHNQLYNSDIDRITFNRGGLMRMTVYACSDRHVWKLRVLKNGSVMFENNMYRIPTTHGDTPALFTMQDVLCINRLFTFEEGDVISFDCTNNGGTTLPDDCWITVIMNITGYVVTDDDWNTELKYYPAPFGFAYSYIHGVDKTYGLLLNQSGEGKGANGALDHSFCYYGAWSNLQSCSVRDFLSGMCWLHGKKLALSRNSLSFAPADTAVGIEGYITQIDTYNDKLGQTNTFAFDNGARKEGFPIENTFLEKEVEIHKSPFEATDAPDGQTAVFNQYKWDTTMTEPDRTGHSWADNVDVDFEQLGLTVVKRGVVGGVYSLVGGPDIDMMGLDGLHTSTTVKVTTADKCFDTDYIYLDGRKYLVADGTWNPDTSICEMTAIEVLTKFSAGGCFAPMLNWTVAPYADDALVTYSLYDNTGAGTYTLTIYANWGTPSQQAVQTLDMPIGQGRTILVTGLDRNTTYRAVASGENECGRLSEGLNFTTLPTPPPSVSIDAIYNITGDSAQITFSIT